MLELLYQTWAIVIAEVKRKVEEEKKAEERAQPPQILHNGMVYIHADIANKPE